MLISVQQWAASVPGGYFTYELGVMLGWLVLWICWLVLAAIEIVAVRRATRLTRQTTQPVLVHDVRRGHWRLALVPMLTAVAMLMSTLDLGQRIRFEIDQSELDAAAAKVRSGEIDPKTPNLHSIGSMGPIKSVENRAGCVLIEMDDGAGFLSSEGYAHCPGGPPELHEHRFELMKDDWYEWHNTETY
jgi:hypothetical protein